jgi:hypothetical protein
MQNHAVVAPPSRDILHSASQVIGFAGALRCQGLETIDTLLAFIFITCMGALYLVAINHRSHDFDERCNTYGSRLAQLMFFADAGSHY